MIRESKMGCNRFFSMFRVMFNGRPMVPHAFLDGVACFTYVLHVTYGTLNNIHNVGSNARDCVIDGVR